MKKRILALLCALACSVAFLTSCGGSSPEQSAGPSENTGSASADAAGANAPAASVETLVLKGGATYSLTSTSFAYCSSFTEILEEVSGGAMTVEWFGASTLGNTAQHYAQLKSGTLDFFSTAFDTATTLQNAEDFAVCVVPYAFSGMDHFRSFLASDLLDSMLVDVEPVNNVKFMGSICMNLPRGLSTSKKPVKTPEDLKGMKIRTPESPAVTEVWKAWGANPVQISVSDLFTSLEGGVADGQDNNVLSMWSNSYYEVQDYYMELEYIQQAQVLWMSADSWGKLDETQQGWLLEAIEKAEKANSQDALDQYEGCKANLMENGFEFIEFDRKAFEDSAEQVARTLEGKLYREGIYDEIKALDK